MNDEVRGQNIKELDNDEEPGQRVECQLENFHEKLRFTVLSLHLKWALRS